MLTDLYVIDTFSGKIHKVGENPHDSLRVTIDGLHYENLQNGDRGTVNRGGYIILKSAYGMLEGEYGIYDKRFEKEIRDYLNKKLEDKK